MTAVHAAEDPVVQLVSNGLGDFCVLRRSGALECVGEGRGPTPATPLAQIAIAYRNCAIDQQGELLCWPLDGYENIPPQGVQLDVAVGSFACSIREDQHVGC